MSVTLAPHSLAQKPWRPITDAEWAALRVWLPHGDPDQPHRGPGRPPRDLRKTVDAIFWIAASSGPWKDLPTELGKPGTAHRTLSRWARAGVLEPLLIKATHPDAEGSPPLKALGWWLARAFRRMAKIVSTAALALVRAADDEARDARHRTHRIIGRALRAGWRQLRLGVCGNRHQWRLK